MSPQTIQNADLYHNRFVQEWHRRAFGIDAWCIDIDLMGACPRCAMPLYLIEATTNPNKSTRILRRLSELANVPAILVRYHDDDIVRATWQTEPPKRIGGEEELKDALGWLREQHRCTDPASTGREANGKEMGWTR